MTSTFDHLGSFYYEVQKSPHLRKLFEIIYDYAIAEVNEINPEMLHWDTWRDKKLYGEGFEGKAMFLSDAHSILDHYRNEDAKSYRKRHPYHLRCVNQRLDYIIGRVHDWFVVYKDRKPYDRFYGLTRFRPKTRRLYPKVFKELLALIDSGVIPIPDYDKRAKKVFEKWRKELKDSHA